MIDALLSAKLAACSFDGDRRLLVQRILNALGQPAPMQTRWVQWEGKRAQLCQWGDVVLVGGTVLLAADLEEAGGKAARRGVPRAPTGAAPTTSTLPPDDVWLKGLLALVTSDNCALVQSTAEELLAAAMA